MQHPPPERFICEVAYGLALSENPELHSPSLWGRQLGIFRAIKRVKEFWEDFESLESVAEATLIKSFFWPTFVAACTATSGAVGHQPLMWILMASALVFMAITTAMLNFNILKERNTPANKIQYGVVYNMDLAPAPAPIAKGSSSRRLAVIDADARMLGPMEIVSDVKRTIQVSQLGIEVFNTATFPMSCILFYADTVIEGATPPRTTFPKPPYVVPAGGRFRLTDERIAMNNIPCGKLTGTINVILKYGRVGKEKFEVSVKGGVEIVIEDNGKVASLIFAPQEASQSSPSSHAT